MNLEIPEILVIDPHPILRDGIVAVLSAALGDAKVAGAAGFPDALVRIRSGTIDLVVTDFRIQGDTVLSLLRELRETGRETRCLVLSSLDEIQVGHLAIRAGASGFVKKSSPVPAIVNAVRSVLAGNHHISEHLSKSLIDRRRPGSITTPGTHLTASELRIFSMIGDCMSVSLIAARLGISVKTVEAHREHIKNKLGYSCAAMVAAAAVRWLDEAPVTA